MSNKLNLQVPINFLGYGVVGFNLWDQLSQSVDTTLWTIGDNPQLPDSYDNRKEDIIYRLNKDIAKQNLFDPDSPCLKVWHENRLADRIGRGKYFAMPFFEVTKLDSRRKTHLQSVDEVIVSSQWAKDVLINNGIDRPIHVVECGVDREIFNQDNGEINSQKCIFFNCGKWEARKGHDVLYEAFSEAFADGENAELWMMPDNPFLSQNETDKWERTYSRNSNIKIMPRVGTQTELAAIMKKTYCGVFPSRAEGWNLEALEMMSCGKHLIVTDTSAHKQFCNSANSFLLDIHNYVPMYDGKWFKQEDGDWANIEDERTYKQLVETLRGVYNHWKNNPSENNEGIKTSESLLWSNTATKIKDIIYGN